MTIRYRLTLSTGVIETIDNPAMLDIATSGALVIYDRANVLAHAIAPGHWTSVRIVPPEEPAASGPDLYREATREGSLGA